MKAEFRFDTGRTKQAEVYDDAGGPDWHYPAFVFGNEFGPVGVIRAESYDTAYEIWLDEFAPIEEDLPQECADDWERGQNCDCHDMAPNGARSGSESNSPFRYTSPYEWLEEWTGPQKRIGYEVLIEEDDEEDAA